MVLQSNYINDNLDIAPFKSILVIPLTTDLKGGRFRMPIKNAREKLEKNSELIINWMCTIDFPKRVISKDPLLILEKDELSELKKKLDFFWVYFD